MIWNVFQWKLELLTFYVNKFVVLHGIVLLLYLRYSYFCQIWRINSGVHFGKIRTYWITTVGEREREIEEAYALEKNEYIFTTWIKFISTGCLNLQFWIWKSGGEKKCKQTETDTNSTPNRIRHSTRWLEWKLLWLLLLHVHQMCVQVIFIHAYNKRVIYRFDVSLKSPRLST